MEFVLIIVAIALLDRVLVWAWTARCCRPPGKTPCRRAAAC